ncbi:Hypothetical predicted protein [Octopus vulgaris]|uniref:LITAF domain-containing protein n=1 Tax=Octopus vulgaris TaxID=6645 RepID=A0AA36EXM7_OCTVU|nr:Hypothetical predicted protein [Octopus vulgaris]
MNDPPPPYPGAPGVSYPLPEKSGIQPSAPGAYYPAAPYPTAPDMQPPPPQPMMHPQEYGPAPLGGQAWIPPPPPPPHAWAPPPGYGPMPTAPVLPQTTVVIQQHPQILHFGESSVQTRCPKCNADIMTSIHYETGNLSWVICLLLSFFACICGCCLIPFCMDSTKDIVHTCPNCSHFIGRYSRL